MRFGALLVVSVACAAMTGCTTTMDATRPSALDATAAKKVCSTVVCEMPVRISDACVVSSGAWEQILLD